MSKNQFRIRHGQPTFGPVYQPAGPVRIIGANDSYLDNKRVFPLKQIRCEDPDFDCAFEGTGGKVYYEDNGTLYRADRLMPLSEPSDEAEA